MISVAQLRDRVAAKFPETKQVGETTVRFIRTSNEQPFAIYYLDLNQELPSDDSTLAQYLDRVIGADYFEGKKSLQWSNYVYFVTTAKRLANEKIQQAKELIEKDRRYARKFVITERELDDVLSPPVIAPRAGTERRPNVLSIWMQRLSEAGLDTVVLSDEDIPKRLARIENTSKIGTKARPLPISPQLETPGFIRSLELKRYRRYPLQRQFQFGTVNLIVGPNASGKTSFLEAIEFYYCGRNKRNPLSIGQYDLTITITGKTPEKAISNRPLQIFRDRNLAWYGQPEVKSNNLYQSFAKFNFLDTDAAVDVADSTEQIEEDLSKLLIGPEASKIWDSIERLHVGLTSKLRDMGELKNQINEELSELTKQESSAAHARRTSELVYGRLKQMLQRLKWRSILKAFDLKTIGELASTLTELNAIASQVTSFGWLNAPITTKSLAAYCSSSKTVIKRAAPVTAKLELAQRRHSSVENIIKQKRQVLELLVRAQQLVAAGVAARKKERDETEKNISRHASQLAGIDVPLVTQTVSSYRDESSGNLLDLYKRTIQQVSNLETALNKARNDHTTFARLREQRLNLAQQLRQIAVELLQQSPNPDRCPLCHTQFRPHELADHIKHDIDAEVEATAQNLLGRISQIQSVLQQMRSKASLLGQLIRFCDVVGLSAGLSLVSVVAFLANAKKSLDQQTTQLSRIDAEIKTFADQGLTYAEIQRISERLAALQHALPEVTEEAVNREVVEISRQITHDSKKLQDAAEEIAAHTETLRGLFPPNVKDYRVALLELKERVAVTEGVVNKLKPLTAALAWSQTRSISELLINSNSIRGVATELQTILSQEHQDAAAQTQVQRRKAHLQGQLHDLTARFERLSAAHATLANLKEEYPLQSAMETTLWRNRQAIEAIFTRIHSPDEFSGLGSKFSTLKRKLGSGEATLREISTGQRAAFALSIFLAQNSQLIGAPPVMLIDDPIAHIDDLNALSFLDYLREIAIQGQRQIFFATANDKIATLFERKFDFLGSDKFRKIELFRNA